ncbi:MAG: GNAT family N-acetyltransferase [Peptostreptococcaceae bacterium]|nr:GNAT family N-acetyltransferase [Peptostreptococcaceae bacterium]
MIKIMLNKNYNLKYLHWDTNYFGVKSGRVDIKGILNQNEKKEIIDFFSEFKFITISNENNTNENNIWIGNNTNAFLTDLNVQFEKKLEHALHYEDKNITIMNSMAKNEDILNIAKKSFRYSRFFNDFNLPEIKSKNIYHYWTECAFENEYKYFAIAKRESLVVGYLLFSLVKENIIIELIAVDENYIGRKIGKSLIKSIEMFAKKSNIKKIKVGTQADNVKAIQFYCANGFKYKGCKSVYHLWNK